MDKKAEKEVKRQVSAEVIRKARWKCGLSRTQFAKECGVSHQYLAQLENAVYPASEKFIKNMDRLLSKLEIPDAIRTPEEAQLLYTYRELSPESRQVINNAVMALHAAQPTTAGPQPPPQQT